MIFLMPSLNSGLQNRYIKFVTRFIRNLKLTNNYRMYIIHYRTHFRFSVYFYAFDAQYIRCHETSSFHRCFVDAAISLLFRRTDVGITITRTSFCNVWLTMVQFWFKRDEEFTINDPSINQTSSINCRKVCSNKFCKLQGNFENFRLIFIRIKGNARNMSGNSYKKKIFLSFIA